MKSKTALKFTAALICAAGVFCGRVCQAESPEVRVVAKSPYDAIQDISAAAAITATFNQPMAPLTSAEKAALQCPVEVFAVEDVLGGNYEGPGKASLDSFKDLSPVKGRCRWQGTQVLSFEPAEALKPSSLYAVRIKKGLRSEVSGGELAEDEAWFFETPRPAVYNSAPYDKQRWVALDSLLYAAFTQTMEPSRARDAVELEGRGPGGTVQKISVGVRRANEEEVNKLWPYYQNISTANVLAIKPSGGLKPDYSYTLRLKKGLLAGQGALGLAETREVHFSAYKTFAITAMPKDACLPAGYSIGFSNPVSFKEFYKHISLVPAVKLPERGEDEENYGGDQYGEDEIAYRYLPDIEYKPNTLYRFKLSGELTDIFGNKLGADRKFEVQTRDYCPYFTMPAGFGVLEGYLPPRHPAEAVNAPGINIVKGLVRPGDFIPFYRGGMIDDKFLKNKISKLWEPSAGFKNARIRTFLDYSDVIGKDQGGLLFARVPAQAGSVITALDNITRVALTFKTSPDSSFIWTSYLKTGRPAANIPVEIRDDENKVLWSGLTDKGGFADAPGWMKLGITDWQKWSRPSLWLFARHPNGDAVMNSSWSHGVEPWRFSINYDNSPRPRRYAAALFTERGIYRPGETVNLKGVGRKLSGGDWVGLDMDTVQVTVKDSRGNRVLKATAPVSQVFSSFDYSYSLPERAPTGVWTVEVTEPYEDDKSVARAAGEDEDGEDGSQEPVERAFRFSETFMVEAFKPAVFEVKAQSLKDSYLLGDKFSAAVEGWYLFGAPMSGSRSDWTLRLEPGSYVPPGCDDLSFGSYEDYQGFSGQQAGAGSADLDSKGKAEVIAELPGTMPGAGAISATLEAGVTDPERQRMFGRARAWVHRANLYLGLKASGGFVDTGKPWSAGIVAVRPDGKPAAGLNVEAKLIKRQWLSSRRAGLGGRLEWVSEVSDTVVSSSAFVSSGSTDTWTYTPQEGGYYIFSVTGTDEDGRRNASSFGFYVLGGGDSWWAREDSDIIELTAEKNEYKPGDTARILVKSPYAEAQALVTVEREGVMDRWVVTTKGGSDFIKVPIKEKYLPNAYVSVILIKGRLPEQKYSEDGDSDLSKPQAKFGYVNLNVNPGGRRLKVSVNSARPAYRPGETVELKVRVTDENGNPVEAEATVFAVDEGVLSLTGYATPDLFSPFYGPRPLNVMTADSRLHVIGQRSYGEKGEARGGGGGAAMSGIDMRSKFVPTAYWNPSVKTRNNGYAVVSFKLPDNLTRFRLMAAASAGLRFGSGDSSLTVSKPLMLRPSLPRLARPGDVFDCGAVVHNYSELVSSVALSVEVTGGAVSVTGERLRQVSVEGGKAAELVWRCKAEKPGATVFKFRAKAGPETDGLEWTLPVRELEPMEYAATSGATEEKAAEKLEIPYKGAPGNVEFTLSPSALSGLEEGARYLLEYPYGCLEQKLSRAMPVVTGAALITEFKLGSLGTLKAETQKVFDRIGDYQHASGGFCYWTDYCLQPDPYLTAYALEASALAAKEGYKTDPAVLTRASDWLKVYLENSKRDWAYPYSQSEDYAARSYAVYALALSGTPMRAYFAQLYQKRDQLPYLAKAYLLKAAKIIGFDKKASAQLAAEIMNQARYTPTQMHFEDTEEMPWLHNSAVQTTAVMLDALLEAEGGFAGDEKAVKWLTSERKARGRWRTTAENASGLRAFQGYYRRYESAVPDFTAEITGSGTPARLGGGAFRGRTLSSVSAAADFKDIFGSGETANLVFSKSGTGRLYYTARMGFTPQKRDTPASEGFEVSKQVTPMAGGEVFTAGARAMVTITVKTPQDRTFVAVDDPVPAGFEVVNTAYAVESENDAAALAQAGARGGWWGEFERSEQYDDRVLIFADYLTKGEHKYSYIVQATTPGVFYGPSTLVEGMYEPEVFGRTAASEVEIKK